MVKMPILEFRIKRLDAWHKNPFKCFKRTCPPSPAAGSFRALLVG